MRRLSLFTLGCWCVIASLTASPTLAQTGTIGLNFTGVTLDSGAVNGQSLNGGVGYTPPDSDGGVGPNNIVQLMNGAFAVYDKSTGARQELISGRQFWLNMNIDPGTDLGGLGAFNQRIIYDPTSGHWFAAALTGQSVDNNLLLARSDTSNPMGSWQGAVIPGNLGTGDQFLDFTRLGVDAKGVYVSTNNFASASSSFLGGVSVFSFPKADLLAPTLSVANMTRFDDQSNAILGATIQPVINFGPAQSFEPLIATSSAHNSSILFSTALTGADAANAQLSATTHITVTPYSNPPLAGQPNGTRVINATDDRIGANTYQVGNVIYAAHATTFNGNSAITWLKIDATNNQVIQEGILSDPNFDYFQPSIAANSSGNIVIAFNRSGLVVGGNARVFAAVGTTTGSVTTFGTPFQLQVSTTGNYNYTAGGPSVRWGDYATTVVDPDNPNVFWTFNQYALLDPNETGNAWATQITEIIVPEPRAIGLALAALAGLMGVCWRYRRSRQVPQTATVPS